MTKAHISVSLDSEVLGLLKEKNFVNNSDTINTIIKWALQTKEGIENRIEFHKKEISILEDDLKMIEEREKNKLEKIDEHLKEKLKDVKRIITEQPDKIGIWTYLINRDYETHFTQEDLKDVIRRWV